MRAGEEEIRSLGEGRLLNELLISRYLFKHPPWHTPDSFCLLPLLRLSETNSILSVICIADQDLSLYSSAISS